MRINYTDEEDWPGQFALWDANCRRSIKGKAGQSELRELEAALLALPDKRLIRGSLTDDEGGVCAIACYAKHKGVDLSKFRSRRRERRSRDRGRDAALGRVAARRAERHHARYGLGSRHGPIERGHGVYKGGIPIIREMTPAGTLHARAGVGSRTTESGLSHGKARDPCVLSG